MERQHLFDGSVQARCPISVATRHSEIGITRHRSDGLIETLASAPAQDAYLVIVQLRDHPTHDFWADDRRLSMPYSEAGSMGILDLSRQSSAFFTNPVDSLHVHLPRAALNDLAEDAGAPPIDSLAIEHRWAANDATMQRLHPILVDALTAPDSASKLFTDQLILAVATHVATTYGGMRPGSVRRSELAPWQIQRAKEMLSTNLAKEVSLLEVAEACGLSLSYFARAFRNTTGITPHGWLQTCRIERARQLLLDGLPLAEVALACGFADQSHFTRIFKRATGHGPGAWRRLRPLNCQSASNSTPDHTNADLRPDRAGRALPRIHRRCH